MTSNATQASGSTRTKEGHEIKPNDWVEIHGLITEGLNGNLATVVKYVSGTDRYQVRIQGQRKTWAIKASNLRVNIIGMLATHIDSLDRFKKLKRCLRSIATQTQSIWMLVSLSVAKDLTVDVLDFPLCTITRHESHRSQCQHYKFLVESVSHLAPSAMVIFSDDDDLWHPTRVEWYAQGRDTDDWSLASSVCIAGFASPSGKGSVGKISCAKDVDEQIDSGTVRIEKEDKGEYFMFAPHLSSLRKFFQNTAPSLLANKFCDQRLQQYVGCKTLRSTREGWAYYYSRAPTSRRAQFKEGQGASTSIDIRQEDCENGQVLQTICGCTPEDANRCCATLRRRAELHLVKAYKLNNDSSRNGSIYEKTLEKMSAVTNLPEGCNFLLTKIREQVVQRLFEEDTAHTAAE